MTEDHGLSNGDGPVDVAEGHELLLFAVTEDVVLLDGVQRLLFPLQLDDVGVWDDALGKHPKTQKGICVCACACVPLNAYALVLVSLCSNHDISLIQDKHFNLLGVDEFKLQTPVQHGAWRPNHHLLLELRASLHSQSTPFAAMQHLPI
uniref:Uncharacterized protein n=1 Tax=Salmo trutta TaxID=8032 RepID=A0A674BFT6_SALTR